MLIRIKYLPLAVIFLAINGLIYSCGDSRVTQCNRIINIANKGKTLSVAKDAAVLGQVADSLESMKTEMQAVKVGDEKLKGFQTRFISMYSQSSQAIRDASKAKDRAEFEKANKDLQAATSKEVPLVEEMNKYCAGS